MHILSIIFYLLACILLASLHWQKLAVASLHVWNGSSLYLWQNFIGRQFLRLLKMFVFWEPVDRGTLLTSGAGWSRHIAYIGRRRRHSADTLALCHTCFSDMSFNAAGRKLWNSLPTQLHQPDVENTQFIWLFKTFLFRGCGAFWLLLSERRISYLLT